MVLSVIGVNVTTPAIHFPCQCIDNRDTLIGFRLQRLEGYFLGGISISGTGFWEIILRLCNDANCKGTQGTDSIKLSVIDVCVEILAIYFLFYCQLVNYLDTLTGPVERLEVLILGWVLMRYRF